MRKKIYGIAISVSVLIFVMIFLTWYTSGLNELWAVITYKYFVFTFGMIFAVALLLVLIRGFLDRQYNHDSSFKGFHIWCGALIMFGSVYLSTFIMNIIDK